MMAETDQLTLKVQFQKTIHEFTLSNTCSVLELKALIQSSTDINPIHQKLLFKGKTLKDDSSIQDSCLVNGSKIILMASQAQDIAKVAVGAVVTQLTPIIPIPVDKSSWSDLTEHKKIIAKGPLPDSEPGLKGVKHSLPERGIVGLWNHASQKTRLTFKYQEMVIGTNERTLPVNYDSIRNVVSQPIKDQEEYNILALQLGPTEKSNYYLYFVPAQYVEAIKDVIFGRFPF